MEGQKTSKTSKNRDVEYVIRGTFEFQGRKYVGSYLFFGEDPSSFAARTGMDEQRDKRRDKRNKTECEMVPDMHPDLP